MFGSIYGFARDAIIDHLQIKEKSAKQTTCNNSANAQFRCGGFCSLWNRPPGAKRTELSLMFCAACRAHGAITCTVCRGILQQRASCLVQVHRVLRACVFGVFLVLAFSNRCTRSSNSAPDKARCFATAVAHVVCRWCKIKIVQCPRRASTLDKKRHKGKWNLL